jgi:hypothetical protein
VRAPMSGVSRGEESSNQNNPNTNPNHTNGSGRFPIFCARERAQMNIQDEDANCSEKSKSHQGNYKYERNIDNKVKALSSGF